MRKNIDKMLEVGAIQSSCSPWASSVVLVEKKDSDVSFCVNYCKVNQVAKFDTYPMPRVLEEVGPAKYVPTLDLARGYWQVPMAQRVMPFGLHTAPATFQRLMNQMLKECQVFT